MLPVILFLAFAAPTYRVEPITPEAISSPMWESHPAIDPQTGDLWFVRSKPDFSGWRIQVSRCIDNHLQPPTESPIVAPGLEADPYFTPDGRTLYFISSRSTGERSSSSGLDIWKATRSTSGSWEKPIKLPEPVNSNAAEWFPRPTPDGWLYFGSRRPGGFGKDDIYRARQTPNGTWQVENAGPGLNTADGEYEFLPAPNGQWGLLATDKGIYRVEHTTTGWRRTELLGKEINTNGTEIGAMFLGTDGSFLFSRSTGKEKSGELFLATPNSVKVRGIPAGPTNTCVQSDRL